MSGKISKFSNPVVIKDVDCKGVDVVALVKHTIDKKCASFVIRKDEDEHFIISAVFKAISIIVVFVINCMKIMY